MMGIRYTSKTLPPEWRDCESWPTADLSSHAQAVQLRFERLARGIRLYLDTGALRSAAEEAGCSRSVLIDLLNRCVQLRPNGQLAGWLGLVARVRVRSYGRTKPLSAGTGKSGCFQKFLCDNPELREKLHDLIRAGGGAKAAKSHRPTLRAVFRRFHDFCTSPAVGLTDQDYPFNSKSAGRRSIERYAKQFIMNDATATKVWYGSNAASERGLGTGHKSFRFANAPLDVVGLDAHKLDCVGTVTLSGPAGPQTVPIQRIWIDACVDKYSRCVIGYAVSITKEVSATTVEAAIAACTRAWKPRQLHEPGLAYLPGAALPAGAIPGLAECRPCVLLMDNAVQHLSTRIVYAARRALGCAVTFGPVSGWWHNAITERLFLALELYGFQRLPSSTGSHPRDPLRSAPVANAIKHRIDWEELLDLIDVIVTGYNVTSNREMGSRSPLEVLADGLQAAHPGFLPRLCVPVSATTPALGISVETRQIAGCAIKGKVTRPYVELDRVRYSSPDLSRRFELLKQALILHIDEQDMRVVTAYLKTGEPLGQLVPLQEGWAHTRHTREMRKSINALIGSRDIRPDASDCVLEFLNYLARKTHRAAAKKPNKISREASTLADASRIAGAAIPAAVDVEPSFKGGAIRPWHVPPHIKRPNW